LTNFEHIHVSTDLRFPLDGAVELTFSPTSTPRHPSPAPTPAVPVDHTPDPVTRWDSLDTLLSPVDHQPGAMELYATPSHHHQQQLRGECYEKSYKRNTNTRKKLLTNVF
jgi:hypothetical protein